MKRRTMRRELAAAAIVLLAVCAFEVLSPAHATEATPPLALGASGLTLHLDLLAQSAPGGSWTAQDTDDLTISDLANGEYVIGGLPTASGTTRYHLAVSLDGDPERHLATTTYGAAPGTRILWRQELQLPPQPVTFKRGDTYGSIALQVIRRLPAAACAPETTATFSAWSIGGGATAWSGRTATISDCALEATTGTYGATLTYDLQSGDTATAGRYLGEFKICYSLGSCHTLPADNRLEWRVVEAFD